MEKLKKYPSYKESGIEWLREIPSDWKEVKIKWLTSVKRGASPRPIDNPVYFHEEGEYAWVRIADVTKTNVYLESTEQRLSEIGSKRSVKLDPGELFLSIAGSVGKPCITNIKCCIHDGFVYFPELKIEKRYLYYIFASGEPYKGLGKMGTQLNLNTDTVGSIYIPKSSMYEQREIINFLDKQTTEIDSLISDKKKLIELLEEKRQTIITEAVTKGLNPNVKMKDSGVDWIGEIPEHWNLVKLKRCLKVMNGREIQSEIGIDDPRGVNVFGSGGIFKKTDKSLYNGQSVLFGRKGTIGKPIYVEGEFWTVDTMYFTKFYQGMLPKWFYYMFNVFPWDLHVTITALPSIVGTDIENEFWAVPDLNEQKQIVELLESKTSKISEIKIEIKQQINNLKEYRQSLIYEAATGKIDVRNYKGEEV